MKHCLGNIKLFLLDMDGTFYLGDELLDGARDFVEKINSCDDKDFIFVTNNSSKNRYNYVDKLKGMGFDFAPEKIITSGEATTIYINKLKQNARVYLVGTPALEEEFEKAGFTLTDENPDFVVLGFDTTLTYEKMWKLCDFVRGGVEFIATHPDFNCPLSGGACMPDIGGMIAMVEACTGKKPLVIGKPNRYIIDSICTKYNVKEEEVAMVGDRLYTDIAIGVNTKATSILVLTGETTMEDVENSDIKPDYIFNCIGDIPASLDVL